MHVALDLVGLLVVAVGVATVAARRELSAPLILTAIGVAISFVPGVPDYAIEPEVVLVGVLPPLLYATAIRIPLVDLRRNRAPIGLLSVALVLFTAFVVALVVKLVLPDLPFAAALALGAVVAPPDAVAATAVARRVAMPRRVITLLEGESLLNDATALVALRTALAMLAGAATVAGAAGDLVVAVVAGVLVGIVVAKLVGLVRRRVEDPVQDTAIALLVPYLAYLPAERVHGSGVLAVVVCGLMLGPPVHRDPVRERPGTERVLWRTIQFLLESAVFLVIGLQLKELVTAARASEVANGRIALLAAAVLVTVVVARFLWVFPAAWVLRRLPVSDAPEPSPWRDVTVLAWAGMRGVVTMAAAFTLPTDLEGREALTLAAFAVVAGTLLLQGSTLPWLVRRIGVQGPDPAQDALQQAVVTQRAVQAGLDRLDELLEETPDQAGVADRLRGWSTRIAEAGWERLGESDSERDTPAVLFRRFRVGMLEAERRTLVDVRRSGAVPRRRRLRGDGTDRRRGGDALRARRGGGPDLPRHPGPGRGRELRAPERGEAGGQGAPAHRRGLRDLRVDRRAGVGAPADVPDLRAGRLLRLLAAAARGGALPGDRAPGDPQRRAGRGLALVLRGREARVTPVTPCRLPRPERRG